MSDVNCEKIIDRAVENNCADATAEAHAKTCKKCASTLALLALLKTSGSPTKDLRPSAAFINRIENNLTASAAGSGVATTLKVKLLAAAIGVTLTAAIALTVLSRSNSADEHNGKTSVSSTTKHNNPAAESDHDTNINQNTDNNTFPKLQFPAPTDEIK